MHSQVIDLLTVESKNGYKIPKKTDNNILSGQYQIKHYSDESLEVSPPCR